MTEGHKASEQYLELLKLAVEMADRVSARRATADAFPYRQHRAIGPTPRRSAWLHKEVWTDMRLLSLRRLMEERGSPSSEQKTTS